MPIPPSRPDLSIGIVAAPRFTMLALSALVDTLRLAADEADHSRPIRCSWTVMTADGRPIRASNGIAIEPNSGLLDPCAFDYVAIVSGTMPQQIDDDRLDGYLRRAASQQVPLIGICTGSFLLARAGLMDGYRACVSWLHREELATAFPKMDVVGDALYVFDRDRITCAGGTSVVHLASHLVDRHLGPGNADKGLRIMLEEGRKDQRSTQPPPAVEGLPFARDARVRRAMLAIERRVDQPLEVAEFATKLGVSPRQLRRLFQSQLGCSIGSYARLLRLEHAQRLVVSGSLSITEIAVACGFSDGAHLSRAYRTKYGQSPSEARSGGLISQ
jgi:transcriptional regulator GlxA family with amidase domain